MVQHARQNWMAVRALRGVIVLNEYRRGRGKQPAREVNSKGYQVHGRAPLVDRKKVSRQGGVTIEREKIGYSSPYKSLGGP